MIQQQKIPSHSDRMWQRVFERVIPLCKNSKLQSNWDVNLRRRVESDRPQQTSHSQVNLNWRGRFLAQLNAFCKNPDMLFKTWSHYDGFEITLFCKCTQTLQRNIRALIIVQLSGKCTECVCQVRDADLCCAVSVPEPCKNVAVHWFHQKWAVTKIATSFVQTSINKKPQWSFWNCAAESTTFIFTLSTENSHSFRDLILWNYNRFEIWQRIYSQALS